MPRADLLWVEGLKSYPHEKLEVHRPAVGKPLLATEDDSIVAIASDAKLSDISVSVLDLDNIPEIADFIVTHCKLSGSTKNGATE